MTKTFFFEDVVVTNKENRTTYAVNLIETGVFIEKALAEMIAAEAKEDPILIAILLAYIKVCRQGGNAGRLSSEKHDDPPSDKQLLKAITSLLEKYQVEEIIRIFRDLKWFQMKELIYSEDQCQLFAEYYVG